MGQHPTYVGPTTIVQQHELQLQDSHLYQILLKKPVVLYTIAFNDKNGSMQWLCQDILVQGGESLHIT
jgi:hypothetical protein